MNIQVADTSEQSSRTLLRSDRCDDAALDAVERHILPLRTTRGLLLSGLQFAYRTRVEVRWGPVRHRDLAGIVKAVRCRV